MNEILQITIACLVGIILLHVSRSRVRTTSNLQQLILSLADGMAREVQEANQTSDPCFTKLYNQLIELAALAPSIAAGVVTTHEDTTLSKEERRALVEYLNRNAYVIPYIFTSALALGRLEFHAKPWLPARMWGAAWAWILMRFMCGPNGALRVATPAGQTAKQVEEFVRLDTREPANRLVAA